jgi:hypothetical protein
MTDPGPSPSTRASLSPWAVAAALCGMFVLCPLATMAAPLLGVRALADIRANPGRRGRRLAYGAIVMGLVITAAYLGLAWWWNDNVRVPIKQGPLAELAAGFGGDVAAFEAGFVTDGIAVLPGEASSFLATLGERYGALHGSSQRVIADDERVNYGFAGGVARVAYRLHFDTGAVDADAAFVLASPGRPRVLKWSWIAIRDPDHPELVYPVARRDDAASAHRTLPGRAPADGSPEEADPDGG